MQRRLYFLFPNEAQAEAAVTTLQQVDVPLRAVHALCRGGAGIQHLPLATLAQRRDLAQRLETWLWNGNLLLFGVALLAAVYAAWQGAWLAMMLAVVIMLASFLLGERATHLPNVHLDQLADALRHGEVLLMVDVPRARVAEIETLITQRHPAGEVGGVCWHIDAFGA